MHKDENGYMKFKAMSWKTVIACMAFCIIPTTCQIVAILENPYVINSLHKLGMIEISQIYHSVQSFTFSLMCPYLTANLIEKSKASLDGQKLGKMVWLLLYILIFVVITSIHVYNAVYKLKDVFVPILYATFYTLYAGSLIVAMLAISFVCSPIIEEGEDIQISDIDVQITMSLNLVGRTRNIKRGFSPLLITILSFMIIYVLFFTLIGIKGTSYH